MTSVDSFLTIPTTNHGLACCAAATILSRIIFPWASESQKKYCHEPGHRSANQVVEHTVKTSVLAYSRGATTQNRGWVPSKSYHSNGRVRWCAQAAFLCNGRVLADRLNDRILRVDVALELPELLS